MMARGSYPIERPDRLTRTASILVQVCLATRAWSIDRLQSIDRHPTTKPKGRQFVLHAKALHGNPFDGHTLGPVITELERQTGVTTRRIHADKCYRGHNHKEKFRVWISGQVRRVTGQSGAR